MKQPEALRLADELAMFSIWRNDSTGTAQNCAHELRRLSAIEEAAKNLVKVKGRYHTEQAFNQLKDLLK